MKALIFAAGRGVRMMPLTATTPKPLLKLLGKPILEHILEALPETVDEIIVVVGYMGDKIKDYLGNEWRGKPIIYVEQKEQLGTGNALMACQSHIAAGERFLVIYADDMHDKGALSAAILKNKQAIFVARVRYPERFGIVVTNASGRVLGLEEAPKEPKTDLAVTGAYLLDSNIFKYPPAPESNGEYYINSMLAPYMRDYEVYAEIEELWVPIGYPGDLKKAAEALKTSHG
ncbi:MAG: hypothetical protein A2855_02835 [Candidatus Liptonbacteria bacterium RIFCSPHIGHO2_01_FULL_57_28]|uniref:Nucleotidyl transferase domain-containing protein n=1 Tax=Candidatus Liptonbacteria bacterium RIFCSPHIGHO2_01_FULL_57_28 TaxID=1798647 RepID=A0A1G2C9Z9_9BACT|nr:MAG: hypothetical protein A2855_02835 [Candidatus Liptonbacteria bacterium RIFCSPHIGHO2_01_FULL_57_28]